MTANCQSAFGMSATRAIRRPTRRTWSTSGPERTRFPSFRTSPKACAPSFAAWLSDTSMSCDRFVYGAAAHPSANTMAPRASVRPNHCDVTALPLQRAPNMRHAAYFDARTRARLGRGLRRAPVVAALLVLVGAPARAADDARVARGRYITHDV